MNKAMLLFTILYASCIFYFAINPNPQAILPGYDDLIDDKLIHGLEFFALALLVLITFDVSENKKYVAAAAFLAIIILLSEYFQLFVPQRSFSWYDILADAVGSAAGFFIWISARRLWKS